MPMPDLIYFKSTIPDMNLDIRDYLTDSLVLRKRKEFVLNTVANFNFPILYNILV